jgi:O-antigen/teichoic acid export membrane protein
MSVADRLSEGVKATFGANLLKTVTRAALIVLLTRVLLTPSGYGTLNLALSILGVLTILATLGLPKSAARYVTEFVERDPGQVPHVLRRSALYLGTTTVVVSVGVVVGSRLLAGVLGIPTLVPYLTIGGAYVAGRSFSSYFGALFQGFNRVKWSALLTAVTAVGQLVAVVGLALLGYGALGALGGYVVGYALSVTVGAVVLYTRFYEPTGATVVDDLSKRILEYSVPLTATRGANVLDKKVDSVLIGVLVNVTAVGYYTVAKQVSDFVAMPAQAFGFTLSPELGKQKSERRLDSAARLYERSLEYVLLAYVPAVVGLILVAEPMIRYVFGEPYLPAVPVVQVFSGFILVNAVNKITSDALDYLGRARSRAIVKSAMAVSNFGLNLLLIPQFGAVGAAAATVVTYTVYTLSNVYVIHTELSLAISRIVRQLLVVCLVALAMGVAVAVATRYVSGIPSLVAVVALGVAVWGTLSVLGGIIDVGEVAEFLG